MYLFDLGACFKPWKSSLATITALGLALAGGVISPLFAQEEEIVLPTAEVRAKKETAEHVSQEQMTERGDTNLLEAIRWVPGIWINAGHPGFDSGGFGIRGSGADAHNGDHMAIYLDGVPMIDSYRGRIDYNTILSGSLESIDITKGYGSVLMGLNSIGGVLNARTAKPKRKFELDVRAGFDFDAGGFGGNNDTVTVGTRLGATERLIRAMRQLTPQAVL